MIYTLITEQKILNVLQGVIDQYYFAETDEEIWAKTKFNADAEAVTMLEKYDMAEIDGAKFPETKFVKFKLKDRS